MLPQNQRPRYPKMDILFYQAVLQYKQEMKKKIGFYVFKSLLIAIFLPIDFYILKTQQSIITSALTLALIVSIAGIIINTVILMSTSNNVFFLMMAQLRNHIVEQQVEDPNNLALCVSDVIFNATNETRIDSQGLTEKIKKSYIFMQVSIIHVTVSKHLPIIHAIQGFISFLNFLSMIFAIIALGVSQSNKPQLVILIIYIICECLFNSVGIIGLLLLAISPLICIGVCIYWCCCKTQEIGVHNLPNSIKATQQNVLNCDGQCSICFQKISLNEQIIVLDCHPKHLYHDMCISSWARVSNKCPVCRVAFTNASSDLSN